MKPTLILLSYACCLLPLAVPAAVPLSWTVETSRATPAQFEAYQGETIQFEAALMSNGRPLEAPSNYSFFWQTNGMGSTYWETPAGPVPVISLAGASTNVLFATWSPSMDVGARVYNCFIGSPSNIYHAAFQLRLRPSPGATPNVLPLPVPILDFAKVRVLNPPWPTGGTDTNKMIDIIHETVDGAARPLPKYLHTYDADDSYPDAAQEYYRSRGDGKVDGGCSAVRRGGFLYRNFDFPFDDRAEFVVRVSGNAGVRFASVGVAQVGTNLTESFVTSGKPSRWYKALPGATVDGINERGVVAEINVVDGDPSTSGWHTGGDLHPLAAVRWALDNGTSAAMVASNLAARIAFPSGWSQNFHYMIADATSTYIVENGSAHAVTNGVPVMTNFRLYPTRDTAGAGQERYDLLLSSACCITNSWYTRAYSRSTNPPWFSEFGGNYEYMNAAINAWDNGKGKESHRGETYTQTTYPFKTYTWWQSIHTSIYDLTNRTLRVAVQETDDWYTFAVPVTGGVKVETDPTVPAWAKEPNPPPSMTAEEAAEIANNAISTNAATTNLAAKLAAKYSKPSDGIPKSDLSEDVRYSLDHADTALQPRGDAEFNSVEIQEIKIGPNADIKLGRSGTINLTSGDQITFSDRGENLDNRIARLAPAPGNYAAVSNAAMNAATKAEMQETKAEMQETKAEMQKTRQIVQTWEGFLDGSNVVFSITNYLSGTYSLDHAKLQIKELRPGETEYRVVYDSRTEITNHTAAAKRQLVGYVDGKVTELRGEIAGKGDKAWGRVSSTGQEVPISNTVWVTEQNLRIAGGMEYERVAVGEGAIYVLTSKGQTPYMQGDEGSLMLKDDGGTNYFGMVRSDSYTIGCNTDGIRVQGGIVYLDYNVTMSNHPVVWYTPTLEGEIVWEQLNLPDGSAVPGASHEVVWDESPRLGAQECYINVGSAPSGFFKATIEVPGDCRFKTNMPAEVPSLYCTDEPTKKVKIIWNGGNPKLVEAN